MTNTGDVSFRPKREGWGTGRRDIVAIILVEVVGEDWEEMGDEGCGKEETVSISGGK